MLPENKPQWHGLKCTDCGHVIALSSEPLNCYQSVYCYLCAHAHAQVASFMMPIGNDFSTNGLYGVSNSDDSVQVKSQFDRVWMAIRAKVEKHGVAKAYKKLHASKITP